MYSHRCQGVPYKARLCSYTVRSHRRDIYLFFDARFTSFIPKGYVDSHHKIERKDKGKTSTAAVRCALSSGCASP
jgi:hypothetical protein